MAGSTPLLAADKVKIQDPSSREGPIFNRQFGTSDPHGERILEFGSSAPSAADAELKLGAARCDCQVFRVFSVFRGRSEGSAYATLVIVVCRFSGAWFL